MTNLRDVAVYDTEVTAAGVRSFRKARPAVKVYGDGGLAEWVQSFLHRELRGNSG